MKDIQRGFTIIELLLVVAIIGILSSVLLVSLNGAREKGRNIKRMSELKQMANYIASHDNGVAQTFAPAGAGLCATNGDVATCTFPDLSRFVDPSNPSVLCGVSPTVPSVPSAPCKYTVTRLDNTGNPTTQNWKVKTYLEGSGINGVSGRLCVSSTNHTPFQGGSC